MYVIPRMPEMALRVKGKGIRKWILENYSTEKQAERFSRSDHSSLTWGAEKNPERGSASGRLNGAVGVCSSWGETPWP